MLSQIINVYFKLLADHCQSEKQNCCRVYAFSSFFYEGEALYTCVHWNKNMDKQGRNLTTYTVLQQPLPWFDIHSFYPYLQVDIFAHDILLIPIHLRAHWATAVV